MGGKDSGVAVATTDKMKSLAHAPWTKSTEYSHRDSVRVSHKSRNNPRERLYGLGQGRISSLATGPRKAEETRRCRHGFA